MRLVMSLAGIVLATVVTTSANAYVGPGAGIGALGAVLGVVAILFLSVLAIALWPLKKMLRGRSKAGADAGVNAGANSGANAGLEDAGAERKR